MGARIKSTARTAGTPLLSWLLVPWLLFAAAAWAGSPAPLGDLADKRVLLLYAYSPEFKTSANILKGVRSVLAPRGVRLDIEYMDSKRHFDARSIGLFRQLLSNKLAGRAAYDVVLVSDDNALEFALQNRDGLFAGSPIVFLAVNNLARAMRLDADPGVTGVVEEVSIEETVELAGRLDPDLDTVFMVVDDTPSGQADLERVRQIQRRRPELKLSLLQLSQLSWEELGRRLSRLPPHSAVVRLPSFRDRTGEVLGHEQAMAFFIRRANAPTYELRDHGVGRGAVGGVVVSFFEQGRHAAELVERILDGTPVAALRVRPKGPNAPVVDMSAVDRFGLDGSALAPETRLLNAPDPELRRMTHVLTSSLLAVFVLCAFAGYLVWLLFSRHRVQERLRGSEERFRTMVEGSSHGVLIHRHHSTLFANQAYAGLLGYDSPEEILALDSTTELYAPHERERLRGYQRARVEGREAPEQYEYEALRKDGSVVVLHNVVHITTFGGEFATQHNVIDVTERRRHDELVRESEARYRMLVENAPEAILVIDADDGRFVDVNDNALRLFNIERHQLLQCAVDNFNLRTLSDGRSAREVWAQYMQKAWSGDGVTFEWIHRDADGKQIPTEVRLVRLPSSRSRLMRASVTDMSDRKRADFALREKSAQLEATLENIDQGISMMNAELQVVAFNQRFLELLDFPGEHFAQGDPFEKFVRYNVQRGEYGHDRDEMEEAVRTRVRRARRFQDHCFVRVRPNGTVLEIRGRALPSGGMVSTYSDITETHRLSQQLSHQASHDALTTLPNRHEFELRLDAALTSARSNGSEHAMCYLDLDQFKVINDTCGHMAGDELLRRLAGTLRTHIRQQDTLARLGGDEFGVLLDNCTVDSAQRIAGILRGAVEEFRFVWEDKTFRVGVSVGLVPVNAGSGTVAEVLSAADTACYAAKDQGRNRIHLYREDDAELAHRHGEMQWVLHVQRALEEDRFQLHFQPIIPTDEGAREGEHYELLLRMEDEDGQSVPPGVFLPAAERYNLIGRVDRWVVSNALRGLAEDSRRTEDLFLCSINLSGHSLADDQFLDFVRDQFRETGVPPGCICFEVTETAAIANLARAQRFMSTLKELGCSFALDDFGSGLSSFAYLKTLPVDFLKIDGVFVKDILEDPIDLALVKSINEVGHVMGKRTIAEFVENEAVLACLREIGVDYAQGYGIGRPAPIAALPVLRKAS